MIAGAFFFAYPLAQKASTTNAVAVETAGDVGTFVGSLAWRPASTRS
jgi:hypothetical protein